MYNKCARAAGRKRLSRGSRQRRGQVPRRAERRRRHRPGVDLRDQGQVPEAGQGGRHLRDRFAKGREEAATPTARSSSPSASSSSRAPRLDGGRPCAPYTGAHGLSSHAPEAPPQDGRPARHGPRDRALGLAPRLPDVRAARDGQPYPDRGDARRRPAVDRPRRGRGRRGALARHSRGAPVRPARREGRAGIGRLGRRGRRSARHARDQGGPSGSRRDHRSLPLRVHLARALRRIDFRWHRRQRRHARAARSHGCFAGCRGRRRDRAERHDGRARRRAPQASGRRGLGRPADPRLLREVRLRLLRAVPRGRRLHARVRGPARLPDGSGQRRRGGARGAARHRGGRRRRDGEAGAAVSRRHPPREGRDARSRGGVQRER